MQEDAHAQPQDAAAAAGAGQGSGAGSIADPRQARVKKRGRGGISAPAAGRATMPAATTDATGADLDLGVYTWPAKRMALRSQLGKEAQGTRPPPPTTTVPPGLATSARLLRLDLLRKGGARPAGLPPALGPGSPRRGRKRRSDNTESSTAGAGPSGLNGPPADEGRPSAGVAPAAGGQRAGGGTTRASRKERLDLLRSTAALTNNLGTGSGAGAAGQGAGGSGAGVGGEGGLLALEAAKWRSITAHTKPLKFGRSKM
jgi:hypothetical protein